MLHKQISLACLNYSQLPVYCYSMFSAIAIYPGHPDTSLQAVCLLGVERASQKHLGMMHASETTQGTAQRIRVLSFMVFDIEWVLMDLSVPVSTPVVRRTRLPPSSRTRERNLDLLGEEAAPESIPVAAKRRARGRQRSSSVLPGQLGSGQISPMATTSHVTASPLLTAQWLPQPHSMQHPLCYSQMATTSHVCHLSAVAPPPPIESGITSQDGYNSPIVSQHQISAILRSSYNSHASQHHLSANLPRSQHHLLSQTKLPNLAVVTTALTRPISAGRLACCSTVRPTPALPTAS
ncbi:hypothetical protein DPEC_G00287690 [Dallia pectoralis]|uniref:Uncharacterized protein n=1 Tax=Dallia pectoralis TaxID=75939 RepID=A0ACC2FK94_DALPE|nr:hypothetical protein DPEC_G00287690 [Dallia pectoralis]